MNVGDTGMNGDGAVDTRPDVGEADGAGKPIADTAVPVDSAVTPVVDADLVDGARVEDDTGAVCSTCAIDAPMDTMRPGDTARPTDSAVACSTCAIDAPLDTAGAADSAHVVDSAGPDTLVGDAGRDSTGADGEDNICCDGTDPHCDSTRLPVGDSTNPGQFVVSTDGLVVTDTITELVWQRDGTGSRPGCSDATACTWDEAQAYCADLSLGGFTDWRVPHVKELRTIVDFPQEPVALDPVAFPHTAMSYVFWTADVLAGSAIAAWRLLLGNGYQSTTHLTDKWNVRCVRGSHCAPAVRFIVEGGLVRDTLTQRVWQRDGAGTRTGCTGTDAQTCTRDEAQAYCQALVLGGYDDFRLPTIKELDSLVDYTVPWPGPTIDGTAFPDTPHGSTTDQVWSSTVAVGSPWRTDFRNGETLGNSPTSYARVRCVR